MLRSLRYAARPTHPVTRALERGAFEVFLWARRAVPAAGCWALLGLWRDAQLRPDPLAPEARLRAALIAGAILAAGARLLDRPVPRWLGGAARPDPGRPRADA